MSRVNGRMLTCDRCGARIFLKCTGEGEADGGYSRWNNFEPAPKWRWISDIGDVCPECVKDYADMLERYKKCLPQVKEE